MGNRVVALVAVVALLAAGCVGGIAPEPTTSSAPVARALDCGFVSWDDPCTALASPNDSDSKTEVDVVVNPLDARNVFVASKDRDRQASSCVWAVGQYTRDGGHTWNTTYVGGTIAQRMPQDPLYGWKCITDPIMQFDRRGDLHYSLQAYQYEPVAGVPAVGLPVGSLPPEMGNMYHAISHDGGATFPTIFLMHAGDQNVVFHDYMRMGHNPRTGTVFTIWNQLSPGAGSVPVVVAVKEGESVAQPPYYFPKPAGSSGGLSLGESGIVGDLDGKVYAWLAGFNSPEQAWFSTSADDGVTWTTPVKAFDFTAMRDLPKHKQANGTEYEALYRIGTSVEIAVDTSDGKRSGCLYAAWADGAADVADILVRSSCDGGQTWTQQVLASSGPHTDAQWMPRVAVDGLGTIHIVYLSRAYDPEHNLVDAEWARSRDGGVTWRQERITRTSFDGNKGIHQNGFPFLGDYIGVSAVGRDVYMAFPDCHTGTCEIAVAHAVS